MGNQTDKDAPAAETPSKCPSCSCDFGNMQRAVLSKFACGECGTMFKWDPDQGKWVADDGLYCP